MGQRLDEINFPANKEEKELKKIEAAGKVAIELAKALDEKSSADSDSSGVVGSKEKGESKEESSEGAGWVVWLAIG